MLSQLPRNDEWWRPGGIARWRRWARARADLCELASLGSDQVEYIARDLGISASELRLAVSHGPDEANLLCRRMAALHIDPDELSRLEPATFRDLQRSCAMCESRDECARDLAEESSHFGQDWEDYCPNAATLNMLTALESYSHIRA